MPRYYFDRSASPVVADPIGIELAGVEQAKAHAQSLARRLMAAGVTDTIADVEVIVRDEVGEVYRLKLSTDR